MKRLILFCLLLLLPTTVFAKVKVVATLPVFGAIAQAVGGDRVSVTALARPTQDPHFLDPKPSYVVTLNRADLLVHTGLELENGWLPPALLQSRNPKIQTGTPGNVNASQGIRILEIPPGSFDRSMGDIHASGNPHYYLDPRNGAIIAQNIARHLVEVDATGESYYQARLQAFLTRLKAKLQEWQPKLANLKNQKVITYHKTFSYFADWTGLQIIAQMEPKPGIPPNSKHVDWLLKMIPQNQVRGILMAPYYPKKIPDYLSQKASIPVKILPANTKGTQESDYFNLFGELLQKSTL